MELVRVLRSMTGCDSIGSRMRRDCGSVFATNVKDSSLDAGVTIQARSRKDTGWVLFVKTTVSAAAVFQAMS